MAGDKLMAVAVVTTTGLSIGPLGLDVGALELPWKPTRKRQRDMVRNAAFNETLKLVLKHSVLLYTVFMILNCTELCGYVLVLSRYQNFDIVSLQSWKLAVSSSIGKCCSLYGHCFVNSNEQFLHASLHYSNVLGLMCSMNGELT